MSWLDARSKAPTQQTNVIRTSYGFDRFFQLRRCERLENAPHFLPYRVLPLENRLKPN